VGANPTILQSDVSLAGAPGGDVEIRYASTYDNVPADPTKDYCIAVMDFDHSHTSLGADSPGVCGDAYRGMWFELTTYFLIDNVVVQAPTGQSQDAFWYGDPNPVPAQTQTWGRLKALYH
jgi:hypothetical protein